MPKEYRPILNLPITSAEKVYDGISYGFVAGTIVVALWSFLNLPETIPIHWNIKGETDGYGTRWWILLEPVLAIVYAYANSKITQIPHQYNYFKKITKENVEEEYIKGRALLRVVHMIAQFVFFVLIIMTIKGAVTDSPDLGYGFVPVLLIVILAPVAYAIYDSRQGCAAT